MGQGCAGATRIAPAHRFFEIDQDLERLLAW